MNTSHVDSSDVKILDPTVQYKKFKFLKFHDNHRPAYYGTWSKTSKVISSRNPCKKDEVSLIIVTMVLHCILEHY